jgi:hypothetical protein
MNVQLRHLAEQYRGRGIIKGTELLLRPEDAIRLSKDLATLNVLIIGCEGWYYINEANKWIVQDLAIELSVESFIPYDQLTVEQAGQIVLYFLIEQLPSHISFVSLHLDDPDIESLFTTLREC